MTYAPQNFTVWAEIPVTNLDKAIAFYDKAFQISLKKEAMGPNETAMLPTSDGMGVAGHLYPGKPAGNGAGPTVHLAIPDKMESAMERWKSAGGTVLSDPIEIPVGRFAYCLDLDGNSIGLFELKQ